MYYRVIGRATAAFGRQYSAVLRSLSDSAPSEIEMSYRGGGGGYGRRGRGPNRGGGRGQRGGSRGCGGRGGRGGGGSGGGGGAEGHGAPPPPGLRGRALGMWYASRSRAHKKSRERNEVKYGIFISHFVQKFIINAVATDLCDWYLIYIIHKNILLAQP